MTEHDFKEACIKQEHEITELLGEALYGISNEGFPLWGDHVSVTLATVAARRLRELSLALKEIAEYPPATIQPGTGPVLRRIAKDALQGSPTAANTIRDARRFQALRNHSQVMDTRMDGTGVYRVRGIPGRFQSFEAAVDSLVKQEDDHANRPRQRLDDATQARADDAASHAAGPNEETGEVHGLNAY